MGSGSECTKELISCPRFDRCLPRSEMEGCKRRCNATEVRCKSTGICIAKSKVDECTKNVTIDEQQQEDEENTTSPTCDPKREYKCDDDENGACISRSRVNDGRADCPDGSDEGAEIECEPATEFSCGGGRCVPTTWVATELESCEPETRCLDNTTVISSKFVCDGVADCPDLSDECGCFELIRNMTGTYDALAAECERLYPIHDTPSTTTAAAYNNESFFLSGNNRSQRDMREPPYPVRCITIPIIWVFAIITIIGNVCVIIRFIFKYKRLKTKKSIRYYNSIITSNLALADLLMGVGLINVAIQYTGGQCGYRRPDPALILQCDVIGFLTMVSSQTSVSLLAGMTAMRLVMSLRPYALEVIRVRLCWMIIALIWGIAIVLGAVPILLKERFIYGASIKDFMYGSGSLRMDKLALYHRRNKLMLGNRSSLWKEDNFPERFPEIVLYEDYYAQQGFCMPSLYKKVPSIGKVFSMSIVCYNALIIIFIAVSYGIIYRRSTMDRTANSDKRNVENDTLKCRITLIIATDMVCWFPVILTAFINLANDEKISEAFQVICSVWVLPINSCINPFVYSRVYCKLAKKVRRTVSKPESVCETERREMNGSSSATSSSAHGRTHRTSCEA